LGDGGGQVFVRDGTNGHYRGNQEEGLSILQET